jgi:hypothetical protein
MIRSFHEELLEVEHVDELAKDQAAYPQFDDSLRQAFATEVGRFAEHVFREDARLQTLLSGSFTVGDARLAAHYDAPSPGADGRIDLDPSRRAGILTLASVMAVHGKAAQSAPIHRGLLVQERFFCNELPPVPADIDADDPEPDPNVPRRDQFELHAENPCASCHRLIDPVGFGFEHYDGIGAFRQEDGGEAVDATGQALQTDVDEPFEDAVELVQRMAESEQVRSCMATHWFEFATARSLEEVDACALREPLTAFSQSGNLRELLVGLVTSDAFVHVPAPADVASGDPTPEAPDGGAGASPDGSTESAGADEGTLAEGEVLLVIGASSGPTVGDQAMERRLAGLGYTVTVADEDSVLATDSEGKAAVVISPSVAETLGATFRDVAVPVMVGEYALLDDMAMTSTQWRTDPITELELVETSHPLAAGYSGPLRVFSSPGIMNRAAPSSAATVVGHGQGHRSYFAYEAGRRMAGRSAPARRVCFFPHEGATEELTPEGWSLFEASIRWLTGDL